MQTALEAHRQAAVEAAAAFQILPEQVRELSTAFAAFTGATELKDMRDRGTELLRLFDQLYPAGVKIPDALRPAVPIIEALRDKLVNEDKYSLTDGMAIS
jgi:hypothetical protein